MNCGAGQTTQKVPMSLLRGLRGSWALAASAVVSSTLISSTVMSPKWCTPEEDKKEAAILAELKKFKGGVSDAKAREILASLKEVDSLEDVVEGTKLKSLQTLMPTVKLVVPEKRAEGKDSADLVKRRAALVEVLTDRLSEEAAEEHKRLIQPIASGLSPSEFRAFQLSSITPLNYNTKVYRFSLPVDYQTLGLTVTSCLVTKAEIDGKVVTRPYTPISPESALGYFDLLIKDYPAGVMSKHFANLKVGDKIEMKGPFAKLPYTRNMKKAIGMIAGGTGITPMLQLINAILKDSRDNTEIRLIFANETAADILLKEQLDALATIHPNFKVYYTLSKPPTDWTGFTGHVNKSMVSVTLPPPSEDHLILVCGPPGMMQAISGPKTKDMQQGELDGLLKDMGYVSSQVYKF